MCVHDKLEEPFFSSYSSHPLALLSFLLAHHLDLDHQRGGEGGGRGGGGGGGGGGLVWRLI